MRKTKLLLFITALGISASSFAQVKIGSNPTVIAPTSNLEVEASTAGRAVKIDKTTGQVTIADGTQGTGKILTSDAAGGASWQSPGILQIDQTVFIGRQSGTYLVTTWDNTFNSLKDRIPMVVQSGSLTGYNAATKQYTIQASGNYRVYTGARLVGTLAAPQVTDANLYLFPWHVLNRYDNISTAVGPVLSEFWEGALSAGDVVDLYVISQPDTGGAQNITVMWGFLTIVKLAY
jgi:hypothetical protein